MEISGRLYTFPSSLGELFEIFFLRNDVPVVLHPVQVDQAVEMVVFMLEDPCRESLQALLHRIAIAADIADFDFCITGHQRPDAGDAETAFPVFLLCRRERPKARVDHDRRRHFRSMGITRSRPGGDHDDAPGFVYL